MACARIVGEQQLDARVSALHPPRGVDPRRQAKADVAGVQGARVDARDAHQRPQARFGRSGERPQTRADQPAVLAHQRHAIGDRGQGDEVQVLLGEGGVQASGREERERELVGDAGRAELGHGVPAHAGVEDRRPRQPAFRCSPAATSRSPRRAVAGAIS